MWTAKTHIREIQATLQKNKTKLIIGSCKTLGNYETLGNYVIVDINNYSREEFLEDGSFLSLIILLEKSTNKEELLKTLYEIIPKLSEENRETLSRIINYAYKDYFDEETIKDIINRIEKEGGENMLASVEMLEKERRRDIKRGIKIGEEQGREQGIKRGKEQGRKEEKVSLAKKMLKENFAIEIIEKITGLKREKFI